MQLNFEAIAWELWEAKPLEVAIEPFRAYCLVGLLQLALRHPGLADTPHAAAVGRSMAENLITALGAIDPAIAQMLDTGWTSEFDMTAAEFEAEFQTTLSGKEQAETEQRLKAWAKANPKDPLAADIQNTLLELWAIRLDYQRDIRKTA